VVSVCVFVGRVVAVTLKVKEDASLHVRFASLEWTGLICDDI
jgi:hypothetical protein